VNDFAVVGRKTSKLEKLKEDFPDTNFLTIAADISIPSDVDKIQEKVTLEWGKLDILINNAGVVSAGKLQDISDEDIINQININITGLILLTKKTLPLLLKSNEATIMNISSGLGNVAMPYYSVYSATKAAVKNFSEAIRRELIKDSVHVMTVYPTATDTDMMKSASMDGMDSPETVAKAALKGLLNKEIDVILGGQKKKEQVEINFNNPKEIDKMAQENLESLKERTKSHRSM
ncbi:MAG: SDR family NAD(P)-dependent oxidoreductase, partial [Paludibacter sp.]|nr:SDR family NAD(P)-dependent oxidoreductase [Paludibacter sp.]